MHGLETVTAGIHPGSAPKGRSSHILGFNCTACGGDISSDQARKAEGRCRACKRAGRTHDAERLQAEAWRRETTAAALERSRKKARSVAPEVFA